jgi:hypothetical protein
MKRLPRLRSAYVAVAIFILVGVCALAACSSSSKKDSDGSAGSESARGLTSSERTDDGGTPGGPGCGDGHVNVTGEECDGGGCCTPRCKLRSAEVVCDFVLGTKCSGTSGACPTRQALPNSATYFSSSTGQGVCGALESAPVSPPALPTVSPPGTETPLPGPNAQFVSQYVIPRLDLDVDETFSITMKNTGPLPWMAADGIKLGSVTPDSLATWGIDQVSLNTGEMVPPGWTRTFQIPIHTKSVTFKYDFQWRMVLGNGTPFGEASQKVTIPVFCLIGCRGAGGKVDPGGPPTKDRILDDGGILPR